MPCTVNEVFSGTSGPLHGAATHRLTALLSFGIGIVGGILTIKARLFAYKPVCELFRNLDCSLVKIIQPSPNPSAAGTCEQSQFAVASLALQELKHLLRVGAGHRVSTVQPLLFGHGIPRHRQR
jgi:hypothetical protein